jgi:hypothetical protein
MKYALIALTVASIWLFWSKIGPVGPISSIAIGQAGTKKLLQSPSVQGAKPASQTPPRVGYNQTLNAPKIRSDMLLVAPQRTPVAYNIAVANSEGVRLKTIVTR